MTRVDKELDEFGKRTFAPLREAPPPDPRFLAQEKAKFLGLGAHLQQSLL
jgi:hypothetical protein